MAYRWLNRHLKGDNSPVTEPELPKIEGNLLRAFPDELPSDEINTKIDESFVPLAANVLPRTPQEFQSWRESKLAELRRVVFRSLPAPSDSRARITANGSKEVTGVLPTESGIAVPWKYVPGKAGRRAGAAWLIVLNDDESLEAKPEWVTRIAGDAPVLLLAPRGSGLLRPQDPAPFYAQRALPLLGRTLDTLRLTDTLMAARTLANAGRSPQWKIAGRGVAGVIAGYAAILEPRLVEVAAVDPPASHREGPIFLNVLRVLDVPEALGLLAPRPLTLVTSLPTSFDRTEAIYRVTGGTLKRDPPL